MLDEVDCWVFGHTHFCTDLKLRKIRLVADQRGYVFRNAMPRAPNPWAESEKKRRMWSELGRRKQKPLAFDVEKVIEV